VRIENRLALFSAFGEGSLHRTDGTAKGTRVVRRPRDGGPGYVAGITRVPGIGALLRGYSALWKSDGTRAGTVRLLGFAPAEITALGERRALFVADDGVRGSELWFTDGTPGGTHLVADINP
jgi:ELWxxDGT repeat protein